MHFSVFCVAPMSLFSAEQNNNVTLLYNDRGMQLGLYVRAEAENLGGHV